MADDVRQRAKRILQGGATEHQHCQALYTSLCERAAPSLSIPVCTRGQHAQALTNWRRRARNRARRLQTRALLGAARLRRI